MKIFIISAFLLGIVAMSGSAKNVSYAPNDGKHPPGTFNEKSVGTAQQRGADLTAKDTTEGTVPSTELNPAAINTSPNPVPSKGIDGSSYGDTISTDKPTPRQAEEEQPRFNGTKKLK